MCSISRESACSAALKADVTAAFQNVNTPNTAGCLPTSAVNDVADVDPLIPVKTLPLGGAKTCAWAGAAASAKTAAAMVRQRRIARPSLHRPPAVKLEPTM